MESGSKVCTLGLEHVEKTGLLQRSAFDTFRRESEPTVGYHILEKVVVVSLQLWDTGGMESYGGLVPMPIVSLPCRSR
jgi:GTPase SAR1 family protein